MNTQYTYEIEFDVMGPCRNEYETWLARNSLEWVNHETVASFAVRYNNNGFSPEVKLLFGFTSLKKWAQFVTSDEHNAAIEALRAVVTGLNGALWERGGIRLDAVDTTKCNSSTRWSQSGGQEALMEDP